MPGHSMWNRRPTLKTPSIDLKLGEEFGYTTESGDPIVVKVPRSVKEGWVYDLGLIGSAVDKDDAKGQAESARETMLQVLGLVTWWNVDDDEGKTLPILSSIVDKDKARQREARVAVLAQTPVEVTKAIVDKVTSSTRVNPRVEAF